MRSPAGSEAPSFTALAQLPLLPPVFFGIAHPTGSGESSHTISKDTAAVSLCRSSSNVFPLFLETTSSCRDSILLRRKIKIVKDLARCKLSSQQLSSIFQQNEDLVNNDRHRYSRFTDPVNDRKYCLHIRSCVFAPMSWVTKKLRPSAAALTRLSHFRTQQLKGLFMSGIKKC